MMSDRDDPPPRPRSVRSDGLYLRSTPSSNQASHTGDGFLRHVRANQSFKISRLIPIVNSTRPDRQLEVNPLTSVTLAPPSLSRGSSENSCDLEFVYYFEVFLISGVFSVGFDPDDNRGGRGTAESVALHVNGDLWLAGSIVPNWTRPFQNGDTIGCGIVVGSRAKYLFTRNGKEISPGTTDCSVPSIQTALSPCVGLSSTIETVLRTNFGFHSEHRFLWKGRKKIRIISYAPAPTTTNLDDSIRTDEDFLPLAPDLVRGHTIGGGDTTNNIPPTVLVGGETHGSLDCSNDKNTVSTEPQAPWLKKKSSGSRRRSAVLTRRDSKLIREELSRGDSRSVDGLGSSGRSDSGDEVTQDMMEEVMGSKSSNSRPAPSLDLNDIKELGRELRSAALASDDHVALSQFLDLCKSNLKELNNIVQRATMGKDSGYNLGELISVHELVSDSVQAAEKKRADLESKAKSEARESRDIISLLCHLRGQQHKRYKAVWGLLRLTEKGTDEHSCHEILASGGMRSLLTLFKTSDCKELMMVSALTLVYLLPFVLDSDAPPSSDVIIGVIECLQYLIEASVESTGVDISPSEIRTASAFTMANLWFKVLVTKLRSSEAVLANNCIRRLGPGASNQDPFSGRDFFSRRRSSLSSQNGEDVDCSVLIDSFTSLAIMAAEFEASRHGEKWLAQAHDMNVYYEFALIVESICAVEYARPMAIKEGVMTLLLQWLRSGSLDLERPAANAIRNLALTPDNYTAGWVHSELLHANALVHIVKRLRSSDSAVRLAMAEVILSLTVAPHTRAGIIDARGVKYLVRLLSSIDLQAQEEALAVAAGNALLRLAVGTDTSSGGTPSSFIPKSRKSLEKERIINDIIQNGALTTFVSMASAENYGSLRSIAAKMLRIVSEFIGRGGTEREFMEAEAVSALGKILSNDIAHIRSSVDNSLASSDTSDLINDTLSNDFLTSTTPDSAKKTVNEVRHVLRALVNILHSSSFRDGDIHSSVFPETQLKACSQLISSGGVKSLLWVASMSRDAQSKLESKMQEPRFGRDIQMDSSQALASLCPLLLSLHGRTPDATRWAPHVLSALVNFLKNQTHVIDSNGNSMSNPGICVDVLLGLSCLADWEPLKTKLIDEYMPDLLDLHRHENRILSDAATQVCVALGFNEVESGVTDAYLLGDKFNLARSSLIQAMARDEIRVLLKKIWKPASKVTDERSVDNVSAHRSNGSSDEFNLLFPFLCRDEQTAELRGRVRQQFMDLYGSHHEPSSQRLLSDSLIYKPMKRTMHRSSSHVEGEDLTKYNQTRNVTRSTSGDKATELIQDISMHALSELLGNNVDKAGENSDVVNNFLGCHQYPLNNTVDEKRWVLSHCKAMSKGNYSSVPLSPRLRSRVKVLLGGCFPSALMRDQAVPMYRFGPNAHFNFRAIAMPSGRYCSFRREGQLVSKECEAMKNSERVHCTLCFRNSAFASEFAESLLKTLYLCPIIQGLSFSNDASLDESRAHEGSELLPILIRGIPTSLKHLTLDNILSNNAAISLAHVLKGVFDDYSDDQTVGSVGTKGCLHSLAIINSPHLNQPMLFLSLLESIHSPSSPLEFLHTLDLSGNNLGDVFSAKVLSLALSPSSSTSIERLDLSMNAIGEGIAVKGVLQDCVSNEPKLEVLNMAGNEFGKGEGEVAHQLTTSLGDVLANLVSLDLSGNDLTGTFLTGLGGILAFNSNLVYLNISNNQFSSSSINGFLSKLHSICKTNIATKLSFVHLGGNAPALASNQEMVLSEILLENRRRHVAAYLKESSKEGSDSDTNAVSTISDITGEPKLDQKLPMAETITVLFSAPLVWRDDHDKFHPIEMLDFKLEKALLWKCFTEASRNIDLSFDNATTDRLQAVMTRGRKCLHFSGHGHPYCLTFEDGSGGIHWFSVEQLKALLSGGGLEEGEPPFTFVFVSACHSALAGNTFVECGVPHVVCCQQESQLMDRAALSFTRAFYLALAVGRTVKDAFEIGKHAVLSSATVVKPDEEMEKFMLLPEDGNHDVPVFNADEVDEWPLPQMNGVLRQNDLLPTPPQGFLGREPCMYHVLNLVLNRRFVNIVAPAGMGRSSLAAALCQYIDERKSTLLFDDIYYVRSMLNKPAMDKSSPIIALHDQLVTAGKAPPMLGEGADLDEIISEILTSLKPTKSLLVFEKMETLDGTSEAQDFHFFLGQIFSQTKDVHVLVTANKSIGLSPLASIGESLYNLSPLNFRNTLKLFAYHCPHLHTARERKDLVEKYASHSVMMQLGEGDEVSQKMISILGGGVPSKIFEVAYEMTAEGLEELKRIGDSKANGENSDKEKIDDTQNDDTKNEEDDGEKNNSEKSDATKDDE
ncbi:hypothetical protein ACHAWF_013717 [Thalassiosira exigua]